MQVGSADQFRRWMRSLALATALATALAGAWPAAAQSTAAPVDRSEPVARSSEARSGVVEIEAASIRRRAGLSFIVSLPSLENEADTAQATRRSQWILLEDDEPLGPGHCLHAEIEAQGGGRYSHWGGAVVFSSSDGTDPRANGRRYTLVDAVDDAGGRVHFLAAGAMLMVRRGDRIWWPGAGAFEMFAPRFGARRPEVNPARPRRDGPMLVFETPGEYGLRGDNRAARVLVLDDDPQIRPRQIVGFVAANTTGGRMDELDVDYSTAVRLHFDQLFQSDASLDIACGQATALAEVLCRAAGLESRYCGWLGDDPRYAAHTGLEVYNESRGQWEYYDPHFGLAARDRADAVTLALSLHRAFSGREVAGFTVLINKITVPELLEQFHSYRAALQLWNDRSRRTSTVLLMGGVIPATIEPDEFDETEFFSASTGLAEFRARFYARASADAAAVEPSR